MKKGFTLIELLAVIVILAIIALIATPIVLSIISDSKESAGLRSAEMYLKGVEQAISIEKMNNTNFNPNSCDITKEGNLYCDDKDMVKLEVNGETPINGSITFEEGKIKEVRLEYKNDKVIIKDEDDNLVYEGEATLTYTSLGNYQHQASDGTVEAHDTESGTCSKCGQTILVAGLYDENNQLVADWAKLKTYGLDVQKDYTPSSYMITGSMYKVLQSTSLQKGVKVIIPNDIVKIGDYAFRDCNQLISIDIPNSVTSIGSNSFKNCSSLKSVTIPNNATIGPLSFSDCTNLVSVNIPNSVIEIWFNSFQETSWLNKKQEETEMIIVNNILINSTVISGDVVIPENVIIIGNGVFSGRPNITSVTIPNNVTTIGSNTFGTCFKLKSINYNGTKEQWNAIKLGEDWNRLCPEITVHCTDGDIIIPANQ